MLIYQRVHGREPVQETLDSAKSLALNESALTGDIK